uniref:Probable ATP-dependent RNA helicase DDX46 (inferred by orthology to a zebrafish protein) n=1 Tax=Strongyloides venezuelensis TaxID=75913 RepID=A0A0K0FJ68_STRVS
MHQRPMGTGMVCGHVNKITFNIDNEIIITGAVDVLKCHETWGDANFHPILQNAIIKSGYIKPRKKQAFAIFIIANGFDLIHQSESVSGKHEHICFQ